MFTATRGIVSESLRHLPNGPFVQHDVAINPGNSGGPLLDGAGALVGLNTQFQLNAQGIGFAVPADEVRAYVKNVRELITAGKLPYPSDAEISATPRQYSPADVLHAAVIASGLRAISREIRNDGLVYTLCTARQNAQFVAAIVRKWFDVRWSAPEQFAARQSSDAKFLLQLIKWQTDLFGPRFLITDDRLHLGSGRSTEGLDVAEAREMILCLADAVDSIAPRLAGSPAPAKSRR
jgi:hypothetical protein